LKEEKPYMLDLYYIRGILRNRLSYINERLVLEMLEECVHLEASIESLKKHASEVRNWTQWRAEIEEFIKRQRSKEVTEESDEGDSEA
jgi:hypothetical protein